MISPIVAGVYFHEDIVEGSTTAAPWSLLMLIPLLFLRWRELFRTTANIFVGLAGIFVLFTFLKGAACPHYWEVALPFFLAIGALVLGVARFKFEGGFCRGLGWYLGFILYTSLLWGVSWVTDMRSVITGDRMTRAEFRAQIIERSEQDSAHQSTTRSESKSE